jgi:hypothetical protein
MARKRYVSPQLFENEHLGDAPQDWYVLLFVGLWTLADRDGYLEDRQKLFKMKLFPYKERDIEEGLIWLNSINLITRYEVNSLKYIYIPMFTKYQSPHPKEPKNNVPRLASCLQPASNLLATVEQPAGKAFPSFPSLTIPSLTITAAAAREHPFLLALQERAKNPRINWAARKHGFDDKEAQADAMAQVATLEQENGVAAVLDAYAAEQKQTGSLSILEMRKGAAERLAKKQATKPIVTPAKDETISDYSFLKEYKPDGN